MSTFRHFDVEERGGVTVANIVTQKILDAMRIHGFGRELLSLVQEHPRLVLNWPLVDYASSAALQKIIDADEKRQQRNGLWRFCGMNEAIRELFEVTCLDRRFSILSTTENAVQALTSPLCASITRAGKVDVVTIEVADVREEYLAEELYNALLSRITDEHQQVLVDFTRVTNFGPSALGKLIHMAKMMKEHQRVMKLCCISAPVLEVFTVPGLHETVFTIVDGVPLDEALVTF